MSEASSYTANVFMPGCLGPVKRDVYLADDYDALRVENERLLRALSGAVTRFCADAAARSASDAEMDQYLSAGIAAADAERDQLRTELSALKAVPDGVFVWMREDGDGGFELTSEGDGLAFPVYRAALRQPVADERPVCWVNDQQLLLCSKSPRDEDARALPRNIAGSALPTEDCNTPLYARAALSAPAAGQDVGALVEALEHARQFIRNGVELGYIQMPDVDTPDPAHDTLPKIDAALAAHKVGGGV